MELELKVMWAEMLKCNCISTSQKMYMILSTDKVEPTESR